MMNNRMNERIRELAEQAERYTNDTVDERVYNRDFTFGDIDEVYNTKFAELIVRECLSICDKEKSGYNKCRKDTLDFDEKNIYAEGEIAANTIKFKIKKHFGMYE